MSEATPGASDEVGEVGPAGSEAVIDPVAVLAEELAAIDGLAPRERAELLERVQQVVAEELAALDGL